MSIENWAALTKANTENKLVSEMYAGLLQGSAIIEKFATWLLAGTGAIGGLMITNISSILPFLGVRGFKVCVSLLVLSAIAGLISKVFSIHCAITANATGTIGKKTIEILTEHNATEEEIQSAAARLKIKVNADVDMKKVISDFSSIMPWWSKLALAHHLKKYKGHPQIGYIGGVKAFNVQGAFAAIQTFAFLAFIVSGACFAKVG